MAEAADAVRLLLSSTALWLLLLGAGTASASKAVTAHLTAKWPETPLLLEASEFMAEESNEKFWQFLETVQELAIYKKTGLHLWHMEVPGLGIESELQLQACTTTTAMWNLSHVCNLHHNSWQCWIFNPLSKTRDQTYVLMDTSQVHFC